MTAPQDVDAALARHARRQHGLITTPQLNGLGLRNSAIGWRVERGRLHRVYRGVYAVGHEALSQEARWCAAVLAVGPGAVLAYLHAAALWGIWKRGTGEGIDVVVGRRHRPLPGVRVHESSGLCSSDVTRRRGVPVTTVSRTLLDLGDVLRPYQLANVVHEAEFRGLLKLRSLERLIVRYRGRRAVTVLGEALRLNRLGSAGTMSGLEDEFLEMVRAAGLPEPLINCPARNVPGTPIRVDVCWPQIGLVVEVDGSGHDRRRTRDEDAERDARLRAAGYEIVRCTPATFAATVAHVSRRLAIACHV